MIYIAIGPVLLLLGAVILFYAFISYKKDQNGDSNKSNKDKKSSSHIIECEKCSKKLRVPTVTEVLKITCPDCKHNFTH